MGVEEEGEKLFKAKVDGREIPPLSMLGLSPVKAEKINQNRSGSGNMLQLRNTCGVRETWRGAEGRASIL